MAQQLWKLVAIFLVFRRVINAFHYVPIPGQNTTSGCKNSKCNTNFQNVAFGKLIHATNTCSGSKYCMQSDHFCEICYENDHSAKFLTDGQNTTWQSDTMEFDTQYPNYINLTLNLNKAHDIVYVYIYFKSPRPESLAIYKRTCNSCPWIPFQYFSATCVDTYGIQDSTEVYEGLQENRALCTSAYSDITPLTGGEVLFSTLQFRPSANNFETSAVLQEWVTATDLRITLNRMNTFGDELFNDITVLQSYFYSIFEIRVGGSCKCNGHASECILSPAKKLVCNCMHNTFGDDCEKCLPSFNDVPWARATNNDVHQCQACNCNGYSSSCYFDQELYKHTGHGGHCLHCTGNRDGPNCESCKANYYQLQNGTCQSCNCDPIGSQSPQCNANGNCLCKPGVAGEHCDKCQENYYDFGYRGCELCACNESGSLNNTTKCDPKSGDCQCKQNVEGKRCTDCKPGYFNLASDNDLGCTSCFCYGHSSECHSSRSHAKYLYETQFIKSLEHWKAVNSNEEQVNLTYASNNQSISVKAPEGTIVYFVASDKYTGDQRASYDQFLYFNLRISDYVSETSADLILQGSNGFNVSTPIFSQNNELPTNQSRTFKYHLREDLGWTPKLNHKQFMIILSDLKAIKIRATYSPEGTGYLENFYLETALKGIAGEKALWMEHCDCPHGYVGQFCESCAPGFTHIKVIGGPLAPCIPCNCFEHGDICDPETGNCYCNHNTTGVNCESCARGFYGNAMNGTESDCSPCDCPNGGACTELENGVACIECPTGYAGRKCDLCKDGYFGNPPEKPCQRCDCNLNIDQDAIDNCDTETGECLKCIHNTGGFKCDKCLPGYYGNALALPKGDCKMCECFSEGTVKDDDGSLMCDQLTGMCSCESNVYGRNCDTCEKGYFNLTKGEGCKSCNCHAIGSKDHACDSITGQCHCRSGVTGLNCDRCQEYKYDFSIDGCKDCDCDTLGSSDLQCDENGQCLCLENVEGVKCNQCKENKYDRSNGCKDCHSCYDIVQEAYRENKVKLHNLTQILSDIDWNPIVVGHKSFKDLRELQLASIHLKENAENALQHEDIEANMESFVDRQAAISKVLNKIKDKINMANYQINNASVERLGATKYIQQIKDVLGSCFEKINTVSKRYHFGKQSEQLKEKMKTIKELTKSISNTSDTIYQIAHDAKTKSNEAYDFAKSTMDKKKGVVKELQVLKIDLADTDSNLETLEAKLNQAQAMSNERRTLNLQLLSDAKQLHSAVPVVDALDIKTRANDMLQIQKDLMDDIMDMEEDYDLSELQAISTSSQLLSRVYKYEVNWKDLMSKIQHYASKTRMAVEQGATFYKTATELYRSINEMQRNFTHSQENAAAILEDMPVIEDILNYVQHRLHNAGARFNEINDMSWKAMRKADNSMAFLRSAEEEMQSILGELRKLYQDLLDIQEQASSALEHLRDLYSKINKIKQHRASWEHIKQIKEKVELSDVSSERTAELIEHMAKRVFGVLEELQDLNEFEDLNRLENDLDNVYKQIKRHRIKESLDRIEKEHKKQQELEDNYTNYLAYFTEEVNKLKDIADAIPDGCFRNILLEP